MNTHRFSSERGQSLVMVALLFIAFAAILALVLDGGNAYAARRQAQNAADAGALAGASWMCKYNSPSGGVTTAVEYAKKNGAVDPVVVLPNSTTGSVVVTATVQADTFFAGLIGFNQVSPRAVAEAQCKPPVGIGVMPVAWACRAPVVGGVSVPGISCAEKLVPEDCNPYDLDCTYVLMDSVKVADNKKGGNCDPDITDPKDKKYCYTICDPNITDPKDPKYCPNQDLVCSAHGPNLTPKKGCDYVEPTKTDCDLDNDCIDELITGGARSWLDLDGSGGGANELKDWLMNGFDDPIWPHTWLPEESGVATSIFHTAAVAVVGDDVTLPVFNKICDKYPNKPVTDAAESTDSCSFAPQDNLTKAGTNMNFHVVTFATFHVTCVQTGKGQNKVTAESGYQFLDKKECNGHGKAVKVGAIDDNDKTIEGYFKELNTGGYGGSGEFVDVGTFTVVLVR
jgi:hypothetical protein